MSVQAELIGRWDDNITELSDTDRDRVGNPAFADRFRIESPDDWVLIPSVRLGWSHEPVSHFGTAVRFDARASRYTRNSIKNYEVYGLRLSQDLSPETKYKTRFVARVAEMPHFYLRELTVPQESLDQGRTVRDSARFSSTEYSAAIEQVLVPKRLELSVLYGTEKRNYDAPFDERDGDLTGFQGRLDWNPGASRLLSLQAGYRAETYSARGDRARTAALEPDISSDRRAVLAGADIRWGKKGRRSGVSLDVSRETRDFTSSDPADVFHFNRHDTLVQGSLSFRRPFAGSLYLEAQLSREKNDSRLGPGAPKSGNDDVTDYTRDIISFAVGWRF